MAKKKKKKSKEKKKLSPRNKKEQKEIVSLKSKKSVAKKDIKNKKTEKVILSEKWETWNKNFILAGMVVILVILNVGFYLHKKYGNKGQENVQNIEVSEVAVPQEKTSERPKTQEELEKEEQDKIIQALIEKQEMEKWKTYKNTAYGFMLKYPDSWLDPIVVKPEKGVKFRYKVSFRNVSEEADQKGFDVVVYRSNKLNGGNTEPEYTDNLIIKDSADEKYENCLEPDVHEVGPNKYPAIEVVALKDDPCFQETYFLSMQKGSNIFDIVPFPEGGVGYPEYDGEEKVAKTLPEFKKMLSTFELLTIAARKTTVVPKITAPKPVAKVKNVGGKRMCAKKNDKPRKSKENNKGKVHMDMECCLDPDETPNPWCTY